MLTRNVWGAASIALLLIGGLGGCATRPIEPGQSTAPTESTTNEEIAMTGEAIVYGTLTELSEPGKDGFRLLRVLGQGYLPVRIDDVPGMSPVSRGVVVAVPNDFAGGADAAAQYEALAALTAESGEPLTVLRFVK